MVPLLGQRVIILSDVICRPQLPNHRDNSFIFMYDKRDDEHAY